MYRVALASKRIFDSEHIVGYRNFRLLRIEIIQDIDLNLQTASGRPDINGPLVVVLVPH